MPHGVFHKSTRRRRVGAPVADSGREQTPAVMRPVRLTACLLLLAALAWPAPARALLNFWPYKLMLQGEALFAQRDDLDKARQAAQRYRKVLAEQPYNLWVSVRLARTLVWLGANNDDRPRKLELYREALAVAHEAHRQRPTEPGPLYWQGVARGLLADNSGPMDAYKLVKKVGQDMNRLLKLDPEYEYGGAYRVLGRVHTKLPWFMGGDRKKAEAYLNKAITLGPNYWINHLYLADLYNELGREQEARGLLQRVVAGGPMPRGQEAESRLWRNLAARLLQESQPEPME